MHFVSVQEPTDDNSYCKEEEHEQGAGHGQTPKQKSDFDNSYILDYEKYSQTGQNQAQNKLKIHCIVLLL